MILIDKSTGHSLGLDNHINHPGWISMDINGQSIGTCRLNLQQIHLLSDHLIAMLKDYESKADNNPPSR
jgi:hypothetical protein